MSKHTPGPWVAEAQPYDSSSYYIRGHDVKTGRTMTWGKGAVAHIPRSTVMPMEANARLIAAAPELLEALQLIVRGYGVTFQDEALRTLAKDAIAKATGEA